MLKLQNCPIASSNIANLGSDLEKQIKANAAKCEHAWDGAGKTGGTLKIWRIEKFQVVEWPANQTGKFYDGDSYILLHTYKRNAGNALGHDVHFWLGANTSQDEAGTAAYKTVELDDRLGGAPVQHREVQGHESPLFLSYFPNNTVELLKGGIDSGFHHVEATSYKPRLLQVKGTKLAVRVSQVPMSADSLNSGDVFVLDNGLQIIQWNGKKCSMFEKLKAGQVVHAMKDERQSKPQCFMISEGDSGSEADNFWKSLGGKKAVKSADDGGDDAEAAKIAMDEKKLYRLSDASGSLKFTLEKTGNLSKADLKSEDVFIVDVGAEIYVWIGRKSSVSEKKNGLQYAQQYITDNARPAYLPISRVVEGGENEVFNSLFSSNRSRALDVETGFPHECCPHHAGDGGKWAFMKDEKNSTSAAALFGAIAAGNDGKGATLKKNDEMDKAIGEVFGFFSNKVSNHFFG